MERIWKTMLSVVKLSSFIRLSLFDLTVYCLNDSIQELKTILVIIK